MGDPVPDSKTPALIAIGLAVVGIVIAAAQGLTHGSLAGGIIAALGAIPACFGMWKGIQQETQGTLAISVGAVLVALGVGGVLIVLRVIHWIHGWAVVLALVCASAVGRSAWADKADPDRKFNYNGTAMGTTVSVWLWGDDEVKAAKTAELVFTEMKRLDKEMTTWDPASEVSQVIAAAGVKPMHVSDETFEVIARAQDVSRRSHGLFDITVGGFHGLWKFDQDMDGTIPDPAEVRKRLALIGWKDLVMDPKARTIFLRRKGMSITLGGIAKGYAVDKASKIIIDAGYTSFMMQAGGDMYVAGSKGGTPWVVGIRDPRGPRDSMFAAMPIQDHSFSTSGDYERGFVKDGVRYHHILDPRTGFPATKSRSVTVRAKDAFTADAWSKVMFILGPEESMKLIEKEKLEDFDAAWVDDKNQIVMTKGLEGALKILKKPTPGP